MRNIIITCTILLCGCLIYDPPEGAISIVNKSDYSIYVYQTCSDYGVKYIDNNFAGHGGDDAIGSDSTGFLEGLRSVNNIVCNDKKAVLFIISDSVMAGNSLSEIVRMNIYDKKLTVDEAYLRENDWTIIYEP